MDFADRLKHERKMRDWSQEELAEKLYVSRQSISKWENGQNYPSIEIIIKLSDLFGVTIDEMLRSDEALQEKVIEDGRNLKYPRLKVFFDVIFMLGVIFMLVKLALLLINLTPLDIPMFGGSLVWNIGSIVLIVIGVLGAGIVKDIKQDE